MIKRFEEFHVGLRAEVRRTVTEEDIALFATVTGDANPLHLDAQYAKATRFGERIAHGALTAGFISAALTALGDGHLYLGQTVRFLRPVRPGETVTAVAEIIEQMPERQRFKVRTHCVNQAGEHVAEGEALLGYMSELEPKGH